MAEIIELPETMNRQYRVYQSFVTEWLQSEGASVAEIEYVLCHLKPLYLEAAVPFELPTSGDRDQVVKELNSWFTGVTVSLMKAIALRDVELFRLKGG